MRHIHCKLLLAFAFLLFTLPAYAAETRGVKRVAVKLDTGETVSLYSESHALVIGVSDYTAGWPRLQGVKEDVREVTRALEDNGFAVTVVESPDRNGLDGAIRDFISEHGIKPENRLLIYYAGHGYTSTFTDGRTMGYLVPANAPDPNRDSKGFRREALSMQNIETYARTIQSKHALFIFDSCFAGSIFSVTRALPPPSIQRKATRPVRQFITSGSADQQVPDKSVFRLLFTRALKGDADLNRDGYVTGSELGSYLEDGVTNYRRGQQTPQYGKLNDPLLDQGDFIFALNTGAAPAASVAVVPDDLGERLAAMRAAFDKAQQYDGLQMSENLKIRSWEAFLQRHGSDLVGTKEDDHLRDAAEERLVFWKEQSAPAPVAKDASLPPDSEEVEKLWKVYQLAKKRKLSKLADAKLEELVSKHPDTSRGWQARMEKLRRRLEQGDPDSTALGESNILLEHHPRHPEAVGCRSICAKPCWTVPDGGRRRLNSKLPNPITRRPCATEPTPGLLPGGGRHCGRRGFRTCSLRETKQWSHGSLGRPKVFTPTPQVWGPVKT